MKSTLTDLWYGNLKPNHHGHIHAAEIRQLTEYLYRHHQALAEKLDDAGKESLQKLVQCYDDILTDECENAFVQGFSLAVRLLAEAQT